MAQADTTTTVRALPLIEVDNATDRFSVGQEAASLLAAIKGDIAVISVAGMYRTGKSYLLNRLFLDQQDGFTLGHTQRACTKGIWLWGEPIPHQMPDGRSVTLIVLDTEGINSIDRRQGHDVRVFALAILLSSYFIFNSMGKIDEAALDDLSLVVNLTTVIKTKASSGVEDGAAFSQHFPSFLWIVRDFMLELSDRGRQITAREYLENALRPQNGFSEKVMQKNRIRTMLTSFFKDRDCATLVRPVLEETDLQRLDRVPYNTLRPEFKVQIEQLRTRIFAAVKPKLLNGYALDGSLFVAVAESYCEAINNNGVPNIGSAWDRIVKDKCSSAIGAAHQLYLGGMKLLRSRMPVEEDEFRSTHTRLKQKAVALFKELAVGDDLGAYFEELKAHMKQERNVVAAENEQHARDNALVLLQSLYSPVEVALGEGRFKTFKEYELERKRIRSDYHSRVHSVGSDSVWVDCMEKKLIDAVHFFEQQASSANTVLSNRLKDKLVDNRKELTTFKERVQLQLSELEERATDAECRLAEAGGREETTRALLSETTGKLDAAESRIQVLLSEAAEIREKEQASKTHFAHTRQEYENNVEHMQQDHEDVYNEIVSHIDAALMDLGHQIQE